MEEKERVRQEFLNETKAFLQICQNTFSKVLQELDWSPSHFVEQKDISVCCYNPGHIMKTEDLKKHEEICRFTSRGVPKAEALDESKRTSQFFYENVSSVCNVPIDKETLNKVLWDHHVENHSIFYGKSEVPLTTEEASIMLTPSERGALHNYIIKTAKEQHKVHGVETDTLLTADFQEIVKKKALEGQNSKPTSYTEYLRAMRDYKRRRQSYRAKNVHITRKSYTEIIKEVIENQTDYLTEILKEDQGEDKQIVEEETQSQSARKSDSGFINKDHSERVDASQRDGYRTTSHRDQDRSRSHERSRDRDRSRQQDRSQDKESRQRDRSRDSERSRKRDGRSNDRERSRHEEEDGEQDRERKKKRKKDRDRRSSSREHNRDKHRHKHKHKHKKSDR